MSSVLLISPTSTQSKNCNEAITQQAGALSNRKVKTRSNREMEVRAWKNIESQGDSFTSRTGHTAIAHSKLWEKECFSKLDTKFLDQNVYLFGGTDCTGRQQDFFRFEIGTTIFSRKCFERIITSVSQILNDGLKLCHTEKNHHVDLEPPVWFIEIECISLADMKDETGATIMICFVTILVWESMLNTKEWLSYCFFAETKNWNELKLSETNVCPQERTDHSMVVYGGNLYIFGGCDKSTRFDDLWRYDLAQKRWEQVSMSGDIPVPCFGHTAIVHENSHRLVVFGGWDGHNTLDNLYEFNFKTQLWKMLEAVGSIPPHRYRHSAVVFDDNMFVFGGVDKSQVRYNDLQRYNLGNKASTWQGRCVTDPPFCWYSHQFMVGSMYNWKPSM